MQIGEAPSKKERRVLALGLKLSEMLHELGSEEE